MNEYDVLVIGGGAAGMMAAVMAAREGARVLLAERNEKLGKKVYITGKGRCNVTNAAEREEFFRNIKRNPRFFHAAWSALTNKDLMALLESLGVPLKVERGDRVFPVSDRASDITKALEGELRRLRATLRFDMRIRALLLDGNAVLGAETETGERLTAGAVILATGGKSYPSTGSTGDGYALAESAGHTVTKRLPSLVPIETVEQWPGEISGLTLKNVKLSAVSQGKTIFSEQGEMLMTHFGISGPLVLSLSSELPEEATGVKLYINLKPALDAKTLDERLLRDIHEQPRAKLLTILCGLAPRSLAETLVTLSGLSPSLCVSEMKSADRRALAALIQAMPLTVKGTRGFEEAVVTRGGVNVKEINPSTMESRMVSGLFFAGELIDIDALTGGFNLQLAFSTGALAGHSAAKKTAQA